MYQFSTNGVFNIYADPILKAEALKNAKKLKVCLKKIPLYDRNANIVSVCDKLKRSGINNSKQNTEDKVVSSVNLRADSNVVPRGWNTSIASNNNKNDPCVSFNTFKDRRKNKKCIDIKYLASSLKRFSTTIIRIPTRINNGTPNAQISNASGNQNLKEKSTVLKTNEKRDLLLTKESKDRDSVLNRIPCENVGKTRKMPIVTETTVLPTNTIKINDDSSIRDNKTTAFPAQVLPPRDCTADTAVNTNKCSNNVSTAIRMNTEGSLSSNNALKRRAERGVVERQKIVSTKEETEKISTTAEDLCKKLNLSKDKRANSNQSIGNEGTKRIKLDRSVCLKNSGRKRENDDVCDNTDSVLASATAGTVRQMVIAGSSKPPNVAHVSETKLKNEEGILNLVEEKASTSFASTNKEDSDSLWNVWKPSEITSEASKSPAKHKFAVASKTSCDSETATRDDKDTDCISLYADSSLMAE